MNTNTPITSYIKTHRLTSFKTRSRMKPDPFEIYDMTNSNKKSVMLVSYTGYHGNLVFDDEYYLDIESDTNCQGYLNRHFPIYVRSAPQAISNIICKSSRPYRRKNIDNISSHGGASYTGYRK